MNKPGRKLGSVPWNKGLKGKYHIWPHGRSPFSVKTRKKISIAGMGRIPWNKGKSFIEIRGKNNPNWKGGKTSRDQTLRSRIEFKLWKNEVFKNNFLKCVKCGSVKNLIAHHKKDFKNNIKLRYDPANGIIICRACHLKIHDVHNYVHNYYRGRKHASK